MIRLRLVRKLWILELCVQDIRMCMGGCLHVGECYFWGACGGGTVRVLFTPYSVDI